MAQIVNNNLVIGSGNNLVLRDDDNSNTISLTAPSAVASNYTLTFPDNDPATYSSFMLCSTSGVLSYVERESTSHTTSWSGIWVASQSGNILIERIGDMVTLTVVDEVLATQNSTAASIAATVALPARFRPLVGTLTVPVIVNNNGTIGSAFLDIDTSGGITVYGTAAGGTFAAGTNTGGFYRWSVTYSLN